MKTILVIREYDEFSEILSQHGFNVINFEAIKTLPLEDLSELKAKLETIEIYDGIIFTSPKATKVFLNNFVKNEYRGKIYILGNRAKTLFENTNFEIVSRENANTAEEFVKSFDTEEFRGKRLLFLRGDKSLRAIPELLKDIAAIDETIVYRTIENLVDEKSTNEIGAKISRGEINWICFFSPSGVESFIKRFGNFDLSRLKIAAIGTTTAKKAAEENLTADFISPKATATDFAVELIDYLKEDLPTKGTKKRMLK